MTEIGCVGLPRTFGSGRIRAGVFLEVQEYQQVAFGHNALLCGALKVNGAASDFCSDISHGSGPCPPLESGITGVLPLLPADYARSTLSYLAHTGGAAPVAPSCRVLERDSNQVSGGHPERLSVAAAAWVCSWGSESNSVWCLVAVPSFFLFSNP